MNSAREVTELSEGSAAEVTIHCRLQVAIEANEEGEVLYEVGECTPVSISTIPGG